MSRLNAATYHKANITDVLRPGKGGTMTSINHSAWHLLTAILLAFSLSCESPQRKHEQRIAFYSKEIAKNPEDYEAYCKRSDAYRELAEYELALGDVNYCVAYWGNRVLKNKDAGNIYLYQRRMQYCFEMAYLYHKVGKNMDAMNWFNECPTYHTSVESSRSFMQRISEAQKETLALVQVTGKADQGSIRQFAEWIIMYDSATQKVSAKEAKSSADAKNRKFLDNNRKHVQALEYDQKYPICSHCHGRGHHMTLGASDSTTHVEKTHKGTEIYTTTKSAPTAVKVCPICKGKGRLNDPP
mgnify:CR=1 FL=1